MARESKGKSAKKSASESLIAYLWARLLVLTVCTGIGIYLARYFVLNTECVLGWINIEGSSFGSEERFEVSISLLLLSLPVLLGLWWFRTHDTRQQIENDKRQLNETVELRKTSAYHSLLSNGLQLITSDNVAGRCVGLVQLSLARNEKPEYSNQIDMSTQGLTLYMKGQDGSEAEVIKLSGAMLQNLNLKGAIMNKADLGGADLQGVNLEGANLQGAYLGGANLQGANLSGANLERANLKGANFKGANLEGARLNGANLTKSDLLEPSLELPYSMGTNLDALLDGADLKGVRYDESTLFPKGFDLEERGLRKKVDKDPDDFIDL